KANISQPAFSRAGFPIMAKRGEAVRVGNTQRASWVFDGDALWRREDYAAKRAALIAVGEPGWYIRRAWSEEDMHGLVGAGVYDGEIDHPVFAPAVNGAGCVIAPEETTKGD